MIRSALLCWLTLLIVACSQAGQSDGGYRLEYVQDGDSAILCCDRGKKFTVRLLDIDAPEKHQPYANESKNKLKKLLINKELNLIGAKQDRYGRRLVVIEVEGQSVNDTMVSSGAAWVWKYSKSRRMRALQEEARENQKGLWALPQAQRLDPWEWRQAH